MYLGLSHLNLLFYYSAPLDWASLFGIKVPAAITAQITSHNLSTLPLCSRGAGTPARPHFDMAAELQSGLSQAKCSTTLAPSETLAAT